MNYSQDLDLYDKELTAQVEAQMSMDVRGAVEAFSFVWEKERGDNVRSKLGMDPVATPQATQAQAMVDLLGPSRASQGQGQGWVNYNQGGQGWNSGDGQDQGGWSNQGGQNHGGWSNQGGLEQPGRPKPGRLRWQRRPKPGRQRWQRRLYPSPEPNLPTHIWQPR